MKEIIKELKEGLINRELTLLELDNLMQVNLGTTDSIFDNPDEIRKNGSNSYNVEGNEIIVEYWTNLKDDEIVNMSNDEKLSIKVIVTDIYEL